MLPGNRTVSRLVPTLVLAAVAAACTTTGPERARTAREGLETAQVRIADARAAADSARLSLDALLETQGGDLAPMYDAFEESVVTLRRHAESVARLPDQLRQRGDAYFDQWEKDLGKIHDPALRAASASRRGEALATYNRVVGTMWTGQNAFTSLLSLLGDVRVALGNDLTPAGVDAVRGSSDRVAEETRHVRARMDELMDQVTSVADALSSSVPAQ